MAASHWGASNDALRELKVQMLSSELREAK